MSVYADSLTVNVENTRNTLRRIARHDEAEFSHKSILNAMDRFVKSVNRMDETILVPCRLMDLKVGDEQDGVIAEAGKLQPAAKGGVRETLSCADLLELYNMLNAAKVELMWGQNGAGEQPPQSQSQPQLQQQQSQLQSQQQSQQQGGKGHARRPSSVSVASTNSLVSDSESDSGIEAEDAAGAEDGYRTQILAQSFRRHLTGLHRCLQHMTDAADYLSQRYQMDVGGTV